VFSDFRHGIFSKSTIPHLIDAIPPGKFKVADSQVASRWGNILDFSGFDLITPNEREARFALGEQDLVVRPLALELYHRAKCKYLMLKLGERGMLTYRPGKENDPRHFFTVDTFAEKVADPVGAGDALLAYATLALVTAQSPEKAPIVASILGSVAASLACEVDGNVPSTPENVINRLNSIERRMNYSGSERRSPTR
jgi:sugar/nucleoside kinase (ribokinase family)